MPLSHCVRSLEAWLGPMDVQGLRCGRRHRNWPNRTSCGLPTTDLVLSVVDFTDRAVGTDSKSRSRNYPRLPRESVSVYPHEMSLKPRIVSVGIYILAPALFCRTLVFDGVNKSFCLLF